MNDLLRERLWRHLEALPEERLYQVLDYIEFLSSKYARDPRGTSTGLQRFGERLQDQMRRQGVGFSAIRSTLGAVETADKVARGLSEAGRSLLREVGQGLDEVTRSAAPAAGTPPRSAGPRADRTVPREPAPPPPSPPSPTRAPQPERDARGDTDIPVDG